MLQLATDTKSNLAAAASGDHSVVSKNEKPTSISAEAPSEPAAAVSSEPVRETRLPWSQVMQVGLIVLVNGMSMNLVSPFIPFMVADFYPALPAENIGDYSGYLVGAYFAGQVVASFFWGSLADRFGRRPVLLSGMVGTIAMLMFFAFSINFWWALTGRFMWGALNGNIGVAKTYLSEICDDTNQARGMAILGMVVGMGQMIGPTVGGFLARPASKYSMFENSALLKRFPYLLPCLFPVIVGLFSLVGTYFHLPETHKVEKKSKGGDGESYGELRDEDDAGQRTLPSKDVSPDETTVTMSSPVPIDSRAEGLLGKGQGFLDVQLENIPDSKPDLLNARASSSSGLIHWRRPRQWARKALRGLSRLRAGLAELCTRNVILTTSVYSLFGLIAMGMNGSVLALWLKSSPELGGFGFDTTQVGIVIGVGGPAQLVWQSVFYSRLSAKYGCRKCLLMYLTMFTIVIFIGPNIRVLPNRPWLTWICLISFWISAAISSISSFTSVFVLINNSCPPQKRARVNGIGQTLVAIARVVGPIAFSLLFAWTQRWGVGWPIVPNACFVVASIMALGTCWIAAKIPPALDKKYVDPIPTASR